MGEQLDRQSTGYRAAFADFFAGGWLDRQPTWFRDIVVGLLVVIVGSISDNLVPVMPDTGVWYVAAPMIVAILGAVTTFTEAYGRRRRREIDATEDNGADLDEKW
jgi:hypothetical protein